MVDDERHGEKDGELTPYSVIARRPQAAEAISGRELGDCFASLAMTRYAAFASPPVICSSTLPLVSTPTNHSAIEAIRKVSAKVCST